MKTFNGQPVRPRRCSDDPAHIVVDLKNGMKLQVTQRQLSINDHQDLSDGDDDGGGATDGSSCWPPINVRTTCAEVSSQVRAAVRAHGDTLEQAFSRFDGANKLGAGEVTRAQWALGMRALLGRELPERLVEALWPLFDQNGDGVVVFEEFSRFMGNEVGSCVVPPVLGQ